MVKEQFREADVGRKVVGVCFSAGDSQTMRDVSEVVVLTKELYQRGTRQPMQHGPLDTKLGVSDKKSKCGTCGLDQQECVGHFGYIDLEYPVFHVGYFRLTIQTLQHICKMCAGMLLPADKKRSFLNAVNRPHMTYLAKKALHSRILEVSKKSTICTSCGFKNGVVKKAVGAALKIVHVQPVPDVNAFTYAMQHNQELNAVLPKCKLQLLDPLQVLELFQKIQMEDVCLLMVGNASGVHPVDLILRRLAVPPVCIRPSVVSDGKAGSTEDDLTMKLTEMQFLNDVLRKHKQDGARMSMIKENWDYLQIIVALYMNSEMSGVPAQMQVKKFTRSFAQRLKGKQGRFRGNLSGKRVDFSSRTVISPDPNLRIDEVGVPLLVAKTLTFPEIVSRSNMEMMKDLVRRGADTHPGANYIVEKQSGEKKFLKYGNRENIAEHLRLGDVVERHLHDGDYVLFNRQPSLHKISIMAHKARIMPHRTFRFNECACTPYNADFDGDEMNLHVPQTEEAKSEAANLMGLRYNTVTPRSGEPLVAAIQDFITASYILTHKDRMLSRSTVMRVVAAIIVPGERITLPWPAILKPEALWTGKQIMQFVIRGSSRNSPIRLNLSTPTKSFKKSTSREMDVSDAYVLIRNSELLAGCFDKTIVGSGSKVNIFYTLLRDYGEDASINAMYRLARIAPTFLSEYGFSIGIGDVRPSPKLVAAKMALVNTGYEQCDAYIAQHKAGGLPAQPGCSVDQTLEAMILKELSMVRDRAGQACVNNLARHNSPLTMAVSGSKGSFINISQMIACVGQQAISGHRPPDGFEQRSLPHFGHNEKSPAAKGFVGNSFYSGLTPTEFFFHTMAGREGLVDTAVKTAETGYMQRRLVKCLEDLCVQYDGTVRTSSNDVVQFVFGDDALDPVHMEAKDGSVLDLHHLLAHVRAVHNAHDRSSEQLEPEDMKVMVEDTLKQHKLSKCAIQFKDSLKKFVFDYIDLTSKYFEMKQRCKQHTNSKKRVDKCAHCASLSCARRVLVQAECLSVRQCVQLLELCGLRYQRALTEPGTAVGAIGATSIGEPSTQMTLKTFHFAGVASMNITQGVPRIKEIINAVKKISTSIISAHLLQNESEEQARRVKARIEKTTLGEIADYIKDVYLPDDCLILIKISVKRVRLLHLEVTVNSLMDSISSSKLLVPVKPHQLSVLGKSIVCIRAEASNKMSLYHCMQYLKHSLAGVIVKGQPSVNRCVIHRDEQGGNTFKLLVEGTNFLSVLATYGVDARKTVINNAIDVAKVLGIEAARSSIIMEINSTMANHGIALDIRHVMLLADLMTYTGELHGITRTGLARMKDSVLMLASFERTTDHLFEAAFYGQKDDVCGVSECIIMGMPMCLGTGLFQLLHAAHLPQLHSRTRWML